MTGGRVLLRVNRRLERELGEVGGVRKPEMLDTAKLVKRALRKKLGVPGEGKPSKPGEPPRKQSGKLQKSVVSGAVGTAQRIGLTDFRATLLEYGVDTRADAARPRSRRGPISKRSAQAFARKVERRALLRGRKKVAKKGQRIGPQHQKLDARPFFEKTIDELQDQIVTLQVSAIRRRLPGGF